MALGDEETYLNYAAVEALGHMTQPGIAQYLEDKLEHADPKVLCAAIHSLSLIAGEAAVSHIIETLHSNTVRPDGYQKLVCSACVKALGRIRTASAVPVLKQELTQTVGRYMQYDYGSTVVDALMEIGDPAGHPVLLAYANRLKHLQQGMTDNPMGQYYLDRKIEETLAAADQLDSTGGPK
jgi:HEAT repeat protein